MVDFTTTSKINITKYMLIVLGYVASLLLFITTATEPDQAYKAHIFAGIASLASTIIFLDVNGDKWFGKKNPLDTYSYDTTTTFWGPITKGWKRFFIYGSIVIFLITFFSVGSSPFTIISPQLSTVNIKVGNADLGEASVYIVLICAAFAESLLFFGVVPGILRKMFTRIFGTSILGIILTFIAVLVMGAAIFMYAHSFVFQGQDVEQTATFLYGLTSVASVLVFKNIFFEVARHMANNLAVTVFRATTLGNLAVGLVSYQSLIFLAAVILIGYLIYRNRRNKK